ncbi:MAG: hypothetical protein ACOCRX_06775 [Candidatus Woesearchaeota archaeon]
MKPKVPQINKRTGISADYWNEYNAKYFYYKKGKDSIAKGVTEYPIKTYVERFPEKTYKNVITSKNKSKVQKLDSLAEIVNREFKDPSNFSKNDFKKILNKVYKLIYDNPFPY